MADKPLVEPVTQNDAPSFVTRNPDAPQFWDERFERGFTPWDQQGVPSAFAEFAARQAAGLVLIPGCGSAYEAGWLAARGRPVCAFDFSLQAVQAARAQLAGLAASAPLDLQQADFFSFAPAQTPHWIYERAFLCALPPSRRADYAQRMAELAQPGCLLAGFFLFGETGRKGPPFPIPEAELHALLTPYFECIDEQAVLDSLPMFAGRERWLTWRRRA